MRSFSRLVAAAFIVLVLFLLPSGALAAPGKASLPVVRGVSGDLSALPLGWLAWSRGGAPRGARVSSPAALERTWAKAGSAMDPNGSVITPPPPPPPILPPPV